MAADIIKLSADKVQNGMKTLRDIARHYDISAFVFLILKSDLRLKEMQISNIKMEVLHEFMVAITTETLKE